MLRLAGKELKHVETMKLYQLESSSSVHETIQTVPLILGLIILIPSQTERSPNNGVIGFCFEHIGLNALPRVSLCSHGTQSAAM